MSTSTMLRLLIAASGLFSVTACHKSLQLDSVKKSKMPSTQNSAIINGQNVEEKSIYQQHVVGIYDFDKGYICTGTLYENNFVITAAHCLISPAAKIRVIFGLDMYELAAAREQDVVEATQRQVVNYKIHEDYSDEVNYDKISDWNDIAVLKFSGKLPEGYAPVKLLKDENVITRKSTLFLVGYGVSEVESFEVEYKKSKDFQKQIANGEVVCDDDNKNCLQINQSGDGILRQTKTQVFSLQETEFRLQEKHTGTCSGDSGGPAFVQNAQGEFLLAGVTSRGSMLCNDQGVYTSVPAFIPWIEKTMKALK